MTTINEPKILTDITRLDEIFRLRCLAWENSPFPNSINFTKYPNGFSDTLDYRSVHFYSTNLKEEIIGAARLTTLNNLEDLPYPKIFTSFNIWPTERPFLFYSRLVIHPDYRKQGLKQKFDKIRVQYQLDNLIPFSVATATNGRATDISQYGFKTIATVSKETDQLFPFEHRELLLLLLLLEDIKL
jgi:hypothetical protein